MTLNFFILAASDDATGKLIVTAVALVIWGISSLMKWIKKATAEQKEKMRRVRESIEQARQQERAPVQLNPEIARRIPPPVPRRGQQQRVQAKRRPIPVVQNTPGGKPATDYNALRVPAPPPIPQAKLQKRRKQAPVALAQEEPILLLPDTTPATPAPLVAPRAHRPNSVTANALGNWLRPATLRRQFILTELLQPPLSLRENRDLE